MMMYIDPFWLGVVTAHLFWVVIILGIAAYNTLKERHTQKTNGKRRPPDEPDERN